MTCCALQPPAGDLLAALLLARIDQYPGDLAQAVEMAVAGLQAVLLDTAAHCGVAALSGERTAAVSGLTPLVAAQCSFFVAQKLSNSPVPQLHLQERSQVV